MRFDGKVAMVTGGARGIGYATAERFLEEGASVLIADIDEAAAAEAAEALDASGRRVGSVACDIARPGDCERAVQIALDRFGGLHVLHANAGVPFAGPAAEVDPATLDRVIDVNLKGAFYSAQAVVPTLTAQRSGSIVFTSSLQALIARPGFSPYTAAKHGVTGLMKGLALELAPHNVRVNAVAPAATETAMLPSFLGGMADSREEALERFRASVPLGRLAEPIDTANAVLWLSSEEARMVTGHTLTADGGTTAG